MQRDRDRTKSKVFISHQWMDKQLADRLARDLEPFADVWMDYRNLRPGDRIQDRIDAALREMDLVLVLWTEHAQHSSGVKAEIDTALDLGLRVVPCVFTLDSRAEPQPPLPESLRPFLRVDFHHYGTGRAQLAEMLLHLEMERLPEEVSMEGHPGIRLLNNLRGYLNYLANYRSARGVPDQRAEWTDKIISEIEHYLKSRGDSDTVRMLLDVARQSEVDDPEGIGMLVTRLEQLLGEAPSAAPSPGAAPQPRPAPRNAAFQWTPPSAPPPDELARRIGEVVPRGSADLWHTRVNSYIDSAPVALQALASYAWVVSSQAGIQVVTHLQSYLDNADDLIPDHQGRFGLLDDAWLIINTTFRLIESGLLPAVAVPIDWQTIIATDAVVRALIPEDTLEVLTGAVFQMLQLIASEVTTYQPWFTPQGHGYAPTMAAPAATGGSWEDRMNERLLGTGLSVDG